MARCAPLAPSGPSALLLGLAVALCATPGQGREDRGPTDFGRFSETLVRCSLTTPSTGGDFRSCGRLLIDQAQDRVLSIRFSVLPGGGHSGGEELVFAGILSSTSAPMACRNDGRCQPRFPVELRVNAIASGRFNQLGLAATLPRTLLARGQCHIEAAGARCEATAQDGERWLAEGFFPSSQPAAGRGWR